MTVYTIHQPHPRKDEDTTHPDRFVFVREGFYFWAFLLGPLWMLWHGLWLVLMFYLAAAAAVQAGLWALGMPVAVTSLVWVLIALLVGFEAASLRRWTYKRRRWDNLGLVVAPDRESAERRFFDSWTAGSWTAENPSAPQAAPAPPTSMPAPQSAPAVIGLFPEPQPRR